MPRAPSTAYLMRVDGQLRALVPDPYDKAIDGRGARYILTNACVLIVDCPHCDAKPGKPCLTRSGHAAASVHIARSDEAKRWKKRWRRTWAELLEGAAVSVRISLELLSALEKPCPACLGEKRRLNQSGYREPCENCDASGVAPKDEPECPGPDCPMCNGEHCEQCVSPNEDSPCEHDVIERHRE